MANKQANLSQNEDQADRAAKPFRMWKVILITVAVVITLAIAITGGGAVYIYNNLQPVEASSGAEPVIVTIPTGATTQEIGTILEEQGLIRHAGIFSYYVRYQGIGNRLQAGDYRLTPGQTIDEILDTLVQGKTYVETFTFTIPEGFTVRQIADRLAEQGLIDRDTFLKEVNEGDFSYDFVKNIPEDPRMEYRLEGYLYPKTYEMKKGATEHEIIDRMLQQFEKEWNPDWNQQIEKYGLTLHETVTLASIIEREVRSDKERAMVAGVYYNRLRDQMLLQADATVQFIFEEQKEIVTRDDLKIEHPYNTYLNPGLPPGPIANPGIKALEAVANPESHDYFYYVTKKDGSGEHYFARTYYEHQQNIAKSKQNQAKASNQ